MDEAVVREHAETHGQAMVDGDLRRAASDLTPDAQAEAPAVMREIPRSLDAAEILSVEGTDGGACVSRIRYSGEGKTVVVSARWEDVGGRPMIVALALEG